MHADRTKAFFDQAFREDLAYWLETDRRVAARLLALVAAVLHEPGTGIGRPEPLQGLVATWSRRLTAEHRLIYRVKDDGTYFLQARYHYGQ